MYFLNIKFKTENATVSLHKTEVLSLTVQDYFTKNNNHSEKLTSEKVKLTLQ